MLLGFVAYGLSIYYYTYAQRVIGVVLSMIFLGERPDWIFFVSPAIMLLGTRLAE